MVSPCSLTRSSQGRRTLVVHLEQDHTKRLISIFGPAKTLNISKREFFRAPAKKTCVLGWWTREAGLLARRRSEISMGPNPVRHAGTVLVAIASTWNRVVNCMEECLVACLSLGALRLGGLREAADAGTKTLTSKVSTCELSSSMG